MVHKFGGMTTPSMARPGPIPITWEPNWNIPGPPGNKHFPEQIHNWKWRLYCQESITIPANSSKFIHTKFGVRFSLGIMFISLPNNLKTKKATIENETVAETTADVFFLIRNNSDEDIIINVGDELCYFTYVHVRYIR